MDSSEEWLDFRKRLIDMGEEPNDDLIDVLENLCGISKPVYIHYEEMPKTSMDLFLDNVECKINNVQEYCAKFKSKILSKKNKDILRLPKSS